VTRTAYLARIAMAVLLLHAPPVRAATSSAPAAKSPTTLGAKLRKAGAARVAFVRTTQDPMSDASRSEKGWL